jgi:hypothetical protein
MLRTGTVGSGNCYSAPLPPPAASTALCPAAFLVQARAPRRFSVSLIIDVNDLLSMSGRMPRGNKDIETLAA